MTSVLVDLGVAGYFIGFFIMGFFLGVWRVILNLYFRISHHVLDRYSSSFKFTFIIRFLAENIICKKGHILLILWRQ